jgi:hypothetical protein
MDGKNQNPQLQQSQPINPVDPQTQQQLPQIQPLIPINPATFVQRPQPANTAYGGSVESGPVRPAEKPAESPTPPEYGYDVIRRIENVPGSEQMEKKEGKPLVQQPRTPVYQPPAAQQPATPPVKMPKFFGYTVSPQIANNFGLIKTQKGRGDPKEARTWLYILLDKLLKRQTYQK